MIKQIGTKIYYCLITGNVIKMTGDMQGYVKETSFDEDYEIYPELKERNKKSIGLLTFEYGEYFRLSKNATGVMVDLNSKKLVFSYEELPNEPVEPSEIEIIQKKVKILEEENEILGNKIIALEEENKSLRQELSITQDAINDNI